MLSKWLDRAKKDISDTDESKRLENAWTGMYKEVWLKRANVHNGLYSIKIMIIKYIVFNIRIVNGNSYLYYTKLCSK